MTELHFDVVGAEGPRRYFSALTEDQVAHAYLFTGPPGAGKKTFARRLAQSLLCLTPKEGILGYDGTCRSCLLFRAESGRHPDFLEHEGVLRIGDPQTRAGFYETEELSSRDVIHQLSMQSYAGGLRLLLLGDVGFATHEAANALLKFLEEPPRGVIVILTTTAPGRLLPTIRSRTLEVRFAPLGSAQVCEVLLARGYDRADAERAASAAGGNLLAALAELSTEDESLRAQVARWFFESVEGGSAVENWATRETLDEGLETIKALARDWIVAGLRSGAALICTDHEERLRKLPPLEARAAAAMLAKIADAQRLARTNVQPELVGNFVRMALTSKP